MAKVSAAPEGTVSLLVELLSLSKKPPVIRAAPKPDVVATPVVVCIAVCRQFKISPGELRGPSAARKYSFPRWVLCHLLVSNSYAQNGVAKLIGRHHSTVNYSRSMHQDMMAVDRIYRAQYEQVLTNIKEINLRKGLPV